MEKDAIDWDRSTMRDDYTERMEVELRAPSVGRKIKSVDFPFHILPHYVRYIVRRVFADEKDEIMHRFVLPTEDGKFEIEKMKRKSRRETGTSKRERGVDSFLSRCGWRG